MLNTLLEFAEWLLFHFKSMMLTVYMFIKEGFLWAFEQTMMLIIVILEGLGDMFSTLDITGYLTMIPPGVGWVLQQLGIGEATSMIVIALTIRLTLQLIPFTRLGS